MDSTGKSTTISMLKEQSTKMIPISIPIDSALLKPHHKIVFLAVDKN